MLTQPVQILIQEASSAALIMLLDIAYNKRGNKNLHILVSDWAIGVHHSGMVRAKLKKGKPIDIDAAIIRNESANSLVVEKMINPYLTKAEKKIYNNGDDVCLDAKRMKEVFNFVKQS